MPEPAPATPAPDGRIPTRVTGTAEAEVDGELILLSPKDFSYFGATGTAARLWTSIDGSSTVDEVVADLESAFEAPPGVIRRESLAFMEALADAGLIEFRA